MSYNLDEITYEDARQIKEDLEQLFDSRGWKFFQQVLEERFLSRQRELYNTIPASIEQMVQFARLKGGLEEISILPSILQQMYSDVDNYVKTVQKESEQDDAQ